MPSWLSIVLTPSVLAVLAVAELRAALAEFLAAVLLLLLPVMLLLCDLRATSLWRMLVLSLCTIAL